MRNDRRILHKEDVIRLYEELKEVNLEDYWEVEEECYWGAFAGPISKKACDILCDVIHLFSKNQFLLWPTHTGYILSHRDNGSHLMYAFDINQESCVWYVGKFMGGKLICNGKQENFRD